MRNCAICLESRTRCRQIALARRLNSGNMVRLFSGGWPGKHASVQVRASGGRDRMSLRNTLVAATAVSLVASAAIPASAQSLRYANQGDLKSLDPYTLRES